MRKVRDETGETVALFVPEDAYRICIAEMPSVHALSFRRGVGYREKLVLGASGKAILAHMPAILHKLIPRRRAANRSEEVLAGT